MMPQFNYLSRLKQPVSVAPPIEYLNLGGGENLWLSQGFQPYIFTLGDMYSAVQRATSIVVSAPQVFISLSTQVAEPEPETADDFVERYALRGELDHIAQLARESLGRTTQITTRLRRMRDIDSHQLVVEIRYRRSKDSPKRLRNLLRQYASEIPTRVQQKVTLLRLPA